MKKWEKLEDKVNSTLIQKYKTVINYVRSKLLDLKKSFLDQVISFYNKIIPIFSTIKEKIKSISNINSKQIIDTLKEIIESITFKNLIHLVKAPPYKKIANYLKQNSLNISFTIIIFFGFSKVVKEIRLLLPQKNIGRSITSEQSPKDRPEYYLLKNRHLKIENIKIPVSLNKNKRISSIIADVIIECPNRTTQQFLFNAPHLIQDKLNNTIAPQVNTFPLTEEGKIILRKKIAIELTELLKENQFKYHKIQRVNIIQVTSS